MYASSLLITNPRFTVWKKVIQRIRKDKKKTPCAFVRGDIFDTEVDISQLNYQEWTEVRFNPYYNTSFYTENGPIDSGLACLMLYPYVYVKIK